MMLLTPLALLGLLLVPGVVALHLHRRHLQSVEVPSLLVWQDLIGEPARGGKQWRIEYVLLLLLQLLALCALIFALARPATTSTASGPRVYVLDRGALMMAADPAPSRFAAAQGQLRRAIQGLPSGTTVTIILADAQPSVLLSTTDHALAIRRLDAVRPVAASPNLTQAISLGAGLVGRDGHLQVFYARGEVLPSIAAPPGVVTTTAIGTTTDDQSITRLRARCTLGAATCDVLATIGNESGSAVSEDVMINADGVDLGRNAVQLPAHSETDLSFAIPASRRVVELYLTRPDLVPAGNLAWTVIPGPVPTTATIVGDPAHTAPIARALSAIPNVRVVTLTPARYKPVASGVPGLLILAGWLPSGDLLPTPSLLLVDPPRFPGEPAPGVLNDIALSGADPTSPLLDGVDLTSLDIPQGAGERLVLPPALHPVAWTAGAPLIAAGVLDGRRIVTLALDPARSNLSQLAAFPLLIANVLRWSTDWLPSTVSPGERLVVDVPPATQAVAVSARASLNASPSGLAVIRQGAQASVAIPSPGVYTVSERGSWGARVAQIAANVSPGDAPNTIAPIQVSQASEPGAPAPQHLWWLLLGLIAVVILALEWLFAAPSPQRRG